MNLKEYIKKYGYWQEGPCIGCGLKGYGLSMGGPALCPWCDMGKPLNPIDNSPEAIARRKEFCDKIHNKEKEKKE